jgi:hypothetical protein
MLVKLQRPPPDIRIFAPAFCRYPATARDSRWPACAAKHSRRSGANDNGIKPFHTAFLVPDCRDCKFFTLVTPAGKSILDTSLKDIVTPNRVKPKQEENQKKSIFHFARAAKSLIMRRVHVLKMA